MLQLFKKDFYLNRMYLVFLLIFPPLIYVLNMPVVYIYTFGLIFLLSNTFYYDYKNNVNRTIISLPIRRVNIVGARYLFLSTVILLYVLYQWLIDIVAHYALPYLDSNPINGVAVLFILPGISFAVAVSLPIFYYFSSFIKAAFILIILFFIGSFSFAILIGSPLIDISPFIIFVLDIVSIQPFIMLMLFSITFLVLSCQLSSVIFARKDIT